MTFGRRKSVWAEAASWYARMAEPCSEAEVAAFEAWLTRDRANARAYAEMDALYAAAGSVRLRQQEQQLRKASGLRTALALAVILSVLAASWLLWQSLSSPAYAAVANHGAAVKAVRLFDGTQVLLDSGAEIRVRIGPGHREVSVGRGRVRLSGSGAPPLTVATEGLKVTAADALLDVDVGLGGVTVASLKGTVKVAAARHRVVTLCPGETIRFDRGGAHAARADLAWTRARVSFADEPLGRIASLANAHADPDIVFAEPSVASLRVTGVLDLRDTRRLARVLAAARHLRTSERGGYIVLTR